VIVFAVTFFHAGVKEFDTRQGIGSSVFFALFRNFFRRRDAPQACGWQALFCSLRKSSGGYLSTKNPVSNATKPGHIHSHSPP
jgi:hypothetical protein